MLREQLGARRLRFTDDQRRRLAATATALCRDNLEEIADLVTPDTLLRWYRKLIAAKYDGTKRRGPGPRVMETIRELVLTMAKENSSWGYTRICGALANMGHEVGRNTVKRVLPAAVRGRWGAKLRASSGGQFGRPPANGRSAERISADAAVDRPALLLRLWWRGGRRGMAIKGGPPHINNGF